MPNVFNLSDVFLSYSRKDTDFVKKLDEAFKAEGMEVWVDWEDIPLSVNWMQEIEAGIEGANVFVFVISPDSIASEICMKELNYAVTHNKRFIPVLYREVDEVKGQARDLISSHNWIFFRETDNFVDAFAKLLTTIKADFDHLRQHTRITVRANEWDDNNWRADFLLTGIELETARTWLDEALANEKEPAPTESHKLYIETSRRAGNQRQRRTVGIVSAVIIFAILSIFALIQWRSASIAHEEEAEQRQIAEDNSELADEARIFAEEQGAIADGLSRSMALALHADTIATEGDSYSALPFAIAAFETAPTSYAAVSLSNIALNPGPMAWLLEQPGTMSYIATHPSELIAVTASRNNSLIVWDLSVQPPLVLHRLDAHNESVRATEFSPDGTLIASSSNDGGVLLWRTEDGQIETTLSSTDDLESLNVDQLAFSPDGQYLLLSFENLGDSGASASDDRHELRIFDIHTGEVVQIVGGQGYSAGAVAFAPDGSQFLAGMTDGNIWVWDFEPDAEIYNELVGTFTTLTDADESEDTNESDDENEASIEEEETFEFPEPVNILIGHSKLILHMAFNEDGTLLLSGGQDFDIILWDWETQSQFKILDGHTDNVQAADFIPGKNQVLSTSRDRNIIIWDIETGQQLHVMTGHESLPEALAVTFDGSRAITGSQSSGIGIVWDLEVVDFANDFDSGTNEVRSVIYHPNGEWVASVSIDIDDDDDPTLNLWNPLTGERVQEFPDHTVSGRDLAFVLDNSMIVTALGDELVLSDIATGATEDPIDGTGTTIFDIDVHPDGVHVIGATQSGNLLLWNVATKELEDTFEAVNNGLRLLTVKYNPDDSNQVFVSSNTRLLIYDLTTREVIHDFLGHTESIVGMAVNAESKLLVTTDFRRDAFVRNYETRELMNVLTFHTGVVWGVDIDPTGRFVATSAENGEVLLWDLSINALVRRFSGYDGRIRSVSFSPDGQYLIFGEQDLHHIRLYDSEGLFNWISQNRVMDTVTCAEQRGLIINLECDPELNPSQIIEADTEMQGSIHMEAGDEWLYTGRAGEVITITVLADNASPRGFTGAERRRTGGYLDTILTLYNSAGEVVAENDDVTSGITDSTIFDAILADDGEYRIVVGSYNGGSVGTYHITVEQVSLPESTPEAD